MAKHLFVVFSNPVEGREDDYNTWYTDVHLQDALKIPGIVAAQRFKLSDVQRNPPPPWGYMALYDIETDDLNRTVTALKERVGTSAMVLTDALATSIGWFFQPITPKVEVGGS